MTEELNERRFTVTGGFDVDSKLKPIEDFEILLLMIIFTLKTH